MCISHLLQKQYNGITDKSSQILFERIAESSATAEFYSSFSIMCVEVIHPCNLYWHRLLARPVKDHIG